MPTRGDVLRPDASSIRASRAVPAIAIATAIATAIALAGAAACAPAPLKEHRLQDVPSGFLFTTDVPPGPLVLPGRTVQSRGLWVGDLKEFEPQSEIHVTGYAGRATQEEFRDSRAERVARYGDPPSVDYGEIEPLTIDGRAAFAWMETRHDAASAVRSLAYTALIPYDTITYLVRFDTSAPVRLHPDSLKRVVWSWGTGAGR